MIDIEDEARKLNSILETLQLSNEIRPVLSKNNKGERSI